MVFLSGLAPLQGSKDARVDTDEKGKRSISLVYVELELEPKSYKHYILLEQGRYFEPRFELCPVPHYLTVKTFHGIPASRYSVMRLWAPVPSADLLRAVQCRSVGQERKAHAHLRYLSCPQRRERKRARYHSKWCHVTRCLLRSPKAIRPISHCPTLGGAAPAEAEEAR